MILSRTLLQKAISKFIKLPLYITVKLGALNTQRYYWPRRMWRCLWASERRSEPEREEKIPKATVGASRGGKRTWEKE